ncbi:MAG: DUF4127 family protein [Planctomycetota bacterium]
MRILYLPIDGRFTTHGLFCKYASIAGVELVTIPREQVGLQKTPAHKQAVIKTITNDLRDIDAVIASKEMLLHGGLIPSRNGCEPLEALIDDLKYLERIRRLRPDMPVYISASILRTPKTSSNSEEPEYYADYGKEIFEYCWHAHKFECLQNEQDRLIAEHRKKKIPSEFLSDFLTRRTRNHAVNKQLVEMARKGIITRLIIGLDDNAEYGFSVKEAQELAGISSDLADRVMIYAGTDDLQFTLLSKLLTDQHKVNLKILPVYFRPECTGLIPAFESAPLHQTVDSHIIASGVTNADDFDSADIICLINNTDLEQMPQAMSKANFVRDKTVTDLTVWLRSNLAGAAGKEVIIADCCYTNGADLNMIETLFTFKPPLDSFVYAGWNTISNTIGSAITLAIIKKLSETNNASQFAKLNVERLVEDWAFMVDARPEVIRAIGQNPDFDTYPIPMPYTKKCYNLAEKIMQKDLARINKYWHTDYRVSNVHSMWQRTFDFSFDLIDTDSDGGRTL